MAWISALQRTRFIWLNLLFASYLVWLQPAVLERLVSAEQGTKPDWILGGLLLGIQAIEVLGLLFKRPASAYFTLQNPDTSPPGSRRESLKIVLVVFTPIFHILLAAVLTSIALDLLQIGIHEETTLLLQCLSLLIFFAVLTKEAFFAGLMLSMSFTIPATKLEPVKTAPAWVQRLNNWLIPTANQQLSFLDAWKDLAGDLMLLAFMALAYTTAWDFIILSGSPLRAQGSERIFEYLGISLFFFMIYLGNRSVYLMEDLGRQQSRLARLANGLSFAVVWLSALWLIPG
ncbi:MAG: hypothetical protein JW862_04040 [Anaerolineales bacterium]|nr:hypothetical protein [Anaerolineales bacterium]